MDILTLHVIVPVLTVLAIAFAANNKQIRIISAFGMTVQLVQSIILVFKFLGERKAGNDAVILFDKDIVWFESLNIHYSIGVDGISVALILLTSLVICAGIFASWTVENLAKEFFISLIILAAGVFGFFISTDLFTMFLFFELAVIPMYLLIGIWEVVQRNMRP